MTVTVTAADAVNARYEGTITVLGGTDNQTGNYILWAGDSRPVGILLAAVQDEGEATAELAPWQVLARLNGQEVS
jgi:hypothetical protein